MVVQQILALLVPGQYRVGLFHLIDACACSSLSLSLIDNFSSMRDFLFKFYQKSLDLDYKFVYNVRGQRKEHKHENESNQL